MGTAIPLRTASLNCFAMHINVRILATSAHGLSVAVHRPTAGQDERQFVDSKRKAALRENQCDTKTGYRSSMHPGNSIQICCGYRPNMSPIIAAAIEPPVESEVDQIVLHPASFLRAFTPFTWVVIKFLATVVRVRFVRAAQPTSSAS
jgi:hypothetical protein